MMDEDLIKFFVSIVPRGCYGDIRMGEREGTLISVENGAVRSVSAIKSSGFGLRLMKNGVWGFAASTETSKKAIKTAAEKAHGIIINRPKGASRLRIEPSMNVADIKPGWTIDVRSVDVKDKLDIAMAADSAARGKDTVATMSVYEDAVTQWLLGNSCGSRISFYDSKPRLSVASFVRDSSSTLSFRNSVSGSGGFEVFSGDIPAKTGREALETVRHLIGARPVSGGKYDVVLDYSMTGVYTHEAFGHAAEADGVLAGASILEGKLGKRVGGENVTIVDDPTLKGGRGSFPFDQEGTAAKKRVIVDRGVMKSYLHTLETAKRMGAEPNGAARAMDYAHRPIARMSNTFIAPGDFKEDMLDGIKLGVAFYSFQYGYVEPGSGKFMFKSQYGRMIRNGRLAEFVRDAALTGGTLDILNKIDAVGTTLRFDDGTCGKEGQWVPVSSGGPNIRVRGVVVGGQ